MQLEQISPLVPVLAALLGVIGVFIGAKVIKPASYTELFTENRALRVELRETRNEIAALRREFEDYKAERQKTSVEHDKERSEARRKLMVLYDGLDAAIAYLRVVKNALHEAGLPIPEPSELVQDLMDRAHDIRIDP